MRTRRGIAYGALIIAVAIPLSLWVLSPVPSEPIGPALVPVARAEAVPIGGASATDALLALAQRDPLRLVRLGHDRFEREVRDYRCVLVKQERIDGELSPVQEVEVRFRKSPLSIYMLWRRNADQVKRALFMDGPPYVDSAGNPQARVEPAGAIARLLVSDLFEPIHGPRARAASRRSIDECGFGPLFDLMEKYCQLGLEKGELELSFGGIGEVDGRPTFVIIRHLPYEGEGGPYPDARLVLHLDREWLLPVAVESYADRDGTQLLGRYVFTKVERNVGLGDADFEF